MRAIHARRRQDLSSGDLFTEANRSVLIAAPGADEELIDRLFAIGSPLNVQVLVRQDALERGGRELRTHIKQLQDTNYNIAVRVARERFPEFAVVDGVHLHCYSPRSEQLALSGPDEMVAAARSLWSRSRPLCSKHQAEHLHLDERLDA